MKTITTREWTLLAFILVYSFVPTFGGLVRIADLAGLLAIMPDNPRALAAPLPVVLHILSSFVFCLVGALQFVPSVRRHHPEIHRVAGRVVAAAGCVSAATGLWMTHAFMFPAELQGLLLYWTRIFLSVWMVGLIIWAVIAVRSRNVSGHSAAMLRAYAIGQGASTQTVLGIGWAIVVGTDLVGPARDVMMVLAWALNLLLAEFLIRTARTSRPVHA